MRAEVMETQQQAPQKLTPFEVHKADEILDRDSFPDAWRTNEIRVQVLIRAGWRLLTPEEQAEQVRETVAAAARDAAAEFKAGRGGR
jgi:hypothetical protein